MASRTVITLVDDLSGEEADDISTVEFGLDGVQYVVDLTEAHAKDLREELQAYIQVGRRVGGRQKRGSTPKAGTRSGSGYSRDTLKQMREWASGQGYEVSPRGRIPGGVITAWEEAHQGGNSGPHLAAVAEG